MIDIPRTYGWVTFTVSAFNALVKFIVFITIIYQIWKRRYFEYKRIGQSLKCYYVLDSVAYCLAIYIFWMIRINQEKVAWDGSTFYLIT